MTKWLIGLLLVVLALGFGIDSFKTAPGNALMYVDVDSQQYFSPPCTNSAMREQMVLMTRDEMRALSKPYKPNSDCVEQGGFIGPTQSLIASFIWPEHKSSRWNEDGSWLW